MSALLTKPDRKRIQSPAEYAAWCRQHQINLKAATASRCWPDGQAPGRRMPERSDRSSP